MNEKINEHTQALIGELMKSLKIQEQLLCELSRMTSIGPITDQYAEQSYSKALVRRKSIQR